MTWNRQTFDPHRLPPAATERYRFTSVPLCRLCGSIGFITGGLAAFYLLAGWMDIDTGFVLADVEWTTGHIVAVAGAVVAGIVLGLVGFSVGMSIRVASIQTDHRISVLWHYAANGSLIWIVLLAFALNDVLGESGVKQLFAEMGALTSTLVVIGPAVAGSLVIASLLLLTGQLPVYGKPDLLRCLLYSLPVTLGMANLQYGLLNITALHWILVGVVFPLALVSVSAYMVERDRRQKREAVARMQGDS